MAEVAGLVLSGVALASIFKTCLEFIEYFEDGSDWMFDFGLTLKKLDLLKTRLIKLEDIMVSRVSEQSIGQLHDPEPPHHPAGQAISCGLKGVDDILKRASQLRRRYSHNPRSSQSPENARLTGEGMSFVDRTSARERPGQRLTGRMMLVALRVTWVAYDKRRFDTLISDFDFFLSNLEIITSTPNCPLESCSTLEAHSLHSLSFASTVEADFEASASPNTKMPSKPDHSPHAGSGSRHSSKSGQKRQPGHSAPHHSIPQVNTTVAIQHSGATNSTSHTFAHNRVAGAAAVSFTDERGPSEGETGNHYCSNEIIDQALVLTGRITETTNQHLINLWATRTKST